MRLSVDFRKDWVQEMYPLQLIAFGHSLGRNHVQPLLTPFLGEGIENVGSDVSRRDAINSTKINPFDRQALGQLNNSCFGCIILCNDERIGKAI